MATFDPSIAYRHVASYLPGAKEATLIHRTPGGANEPPSHNGMARHRTRGNSDYRSFSAAFVGIVKTAAFDWFPVESASGIADVGDLLEVDGETWVVGQVGHGRWGSQQLLYCSEAVENG